MSRPAGVPDRGPRAAAVRFHRLEVLRRLPHPDRGFTQGLIAENGMVWESTGLYGESAMRRYPLGADRVEASAPVPGEVFGEGICRVGTHLWQLTWRERLALRWDPGGPTLLETIRYNREGWGICTVGPHVFTSDGSSELVRRDPLTLEPLGVVRVRCGGQRVAGLNDLTWAYGRVWANIAPRSWLAGIDTASGEVVDVVDAGPAAERHRGDPEAILNGITALPGAGEFLLTGKRWRFLYHVRLVEGRSRKEPLSLLTG
jgi:glutaminyl-peptide cyclotransferase